MKAERSMGRRSPIGETAGAGSVWDVVEIVVFILTGYASHLYYNLVGHVSSLRGLDFGPYLLTPLDRAMPYVPATVWFYQMAYFVPAVTLIVVAWKIGRNAVAFRRIVIAFLVLLYTHYALYLAVPTSAQSIRLAEDATGSGLLGALVRYQYHIATVWCAWPSLHVSACWFFYRLLARYYPRLRWIYLAWFAGMLVGTVGIKIHYALDGITGLALGEAAYRFVLVPMERRGACGWRWRSDAIRILVHAAILAALFAGIPALMAATGFEGPLYTIVPAK